ncbi:MAG TPA: AsmA family protein [Rhodopila sp.]|nr:AsmA family protein [Rhodopila sp.]
MPVVLLAVLIAVWRWDWFIPIVESRASAAIGRTVTLSHLHVGLGRTITVTADDVVVSNPDGWPSGEPPLARLGRLTLKVNILDYIEGKELVIPLIALERPKLYVAETKQGDANFRLKTGGSRGGGSGAQIGDVRISDGDARFVIPKLRADFDAAIRTEGDGPDAKIMVDAKGTYAAAPITGRFVGGALLSLRDAQHPWPVELGLANGETRLSAKGTLRDPMALKGANITMRIEGPDFSQLEPLAGFPIPKTPAYRIGGKLDVQGFDHVSLTDFRGQLGNSDIGGTITEEPGATQGANGKPKPVVRLDLASNRVDLNDLAGFIGGTPGTAQTANATPQQRQEAAKAAKSPSLLPDKPIHVPQLHWADIYLRYRAAHIAGRGMPLDNLAAELDMVGGRIKLHPISFGVGKGRLIGNMDLTPEAEDRVHAKMDLRMQNLDVSRMMAATHTFEGAGAVSGVGAIDATGNSVASLLGHGNGEVKMAMAGGDLSALLVDLTGLEFGNALLSALGMPQKTQVQCFVGDLVLQQGVVDFRALTLDTKEAITNVGGTVDLGRETVDLDLKTDAKHFSIGSLPTRIHVGGTFKNPAIRPGAEVAARAGAAAGLGVLFVPLAVLPTIQFGTSAEEDARCSTLLQQARAGAGGQALPGPQQNAGNAGR